MNVWQIVVIVGILAAALAIGFVFSFWLTGKKHPEYFDGRGRMKKPDFH